MSYTRPAHDAADASWSGASAYTRPAHDAADASWVPPDEVLAYVGLATIMGTVEAVASVDAAAVVDIASALGALQAVGQTPPSALVAAPSPLSPSVLAFHDFTVAIPDTAVSYYHADFTSASGVVRVPISSWQATLQTGQSSYVQCVVPAVADWVDVLTDAIEFKIIRTVTLLDGAEIEQVMAESPLQTLSYARGAYNYTATVAGYPDPYEEIEDPPEVFERTLAGVQTISTTPSSLRVRAQIDWLLRPGWLAVIDEETSLTVAYINYIVGSNQAYMDIGNRAG